MATPLDPRKKPTSVKIHVSNGTGVDIVWADGHASHYDFPFLRDECPCATCNEKRDQERNHDAPPALAGGGILPMYKPKAKAQAATSVGNYAIQITFSDGHATGIYSYDQLRTICPCTECGQAFRELQR